MAVIPLEWREYARMQSKLAATTSIVIGDALEEALNVIHQDGFQPGTFGSADYQRRAESAARQERHRRGLRREAQEAALDKNGPGSMDDIVEAGCAPPLDQELEVRQELTTIKERLPADDWELLISVARGETYEELASRRSCGIVALRSRVCRIRQTLARRRTGPHRE